MPFVLTLKPGSTVSCGHAPGDVQTAGVAKLQVNGVSVLLERSVVGKTVSGCSTPATSSSTPCSSVLSVTQGTSTKLQVGGLPVLLQTLKGTTAGTPPGSLAATATQTKLTSV